MSEKPGIDQGAPHAYTQPQQPAGAYPAQPTGGYPAQPAGAYPAQPAGGYPAQPAGAYPAQPAGAYPAQPVGGYQQPTTVVETQPAPQPVVVGNRPPDYLIPSIIACLCFCPTGLVAIFFARQARNFNGSGNYSAAQRSANNARTFTIISVVVGVVWIAIVVIFYIVAAARVIRLSLLDLDEII